MIALALAAALFAAPALAEPEAEPAVAEPAADPAPLLACLAAADRDPAAERACAGVQAAACVEGLGAAAEATALAACSAVEAAGWDRVVGALADDILALIRFQAAEAGGADAPAPEEALLIQAQTAWAAFRDADCDQEAAHWGEDPMRDSALAECRLDRNADRALQLLAKRRMWENP